MAIYFSKIRRLAAFGLVLTLTATALSGCAFFRSDSEPLARVNPNSLRLPEDLRSPEDTAWPEARWWAHYGDKQLDALVEAALKDSPSIAVAGQRAELARANIARARASSLPSVDATGNLTREKVSYEGFLGPFAASGPADQNITGPWYTTGNLGLSGAYELDIWGKNRAKVNAAIGRHKAALAERAAAELAIVCAVSGTYWDMQTLMARRAILDKTRSRESLLLEWQTARHAHGLAAKTDADLAGSRLAAAGRDLAVVDGEILLLREGLRAMIGLENDLPAIQPVSLPVTAMAAPSELGYELLARRPDLQAAHWYIEASLSEVDAARAAFYPSFNITAFLGLDAIHLKDLFRYGSEQFNLIGGLTLPIFDSGRLNANLKAVRAESDLNIASYNKAVVEAVREVAQAATRLRAIDLQLASQAGVMAGLERALADAEARERHGLADRSDVAKADLPLLQARDKDVELRGRRLYAELELIKALGGGER